VKIKIHSDAEEDLLQGHDFYEDLCPGLGLEFLLHMDSEIQLLRKTFAMHPVARGKYHRAVVRKRFPYSIYYRFDAERIYIDLIFDCRRDPDYVDTRLR
jgi:hypothetical protein